MSIIKSKSKKSQDKEPAPMKHSLAMAYNIKKNSGKKIAKGSSIDPSDLMSDDERAKGIVDAILEKRKAKKMADGGMVDIQSDNGDEEPANPNGFDTQNANLKELYDDEQISPQPMDSNEHGDEIDSDAHDMIAKIRSRIKLKRGM